ncbi:MAG: ABC transporter ATP-binding protein [Aigarchaeota archaeon]|nr:ABC transporter ATP-binding protein [Candidatus Pelearchaeum maunauluense]
MSLDGVAVAAEGLRKIYSGGVVALDGVSLEIRAGRIFSLLGRNGAGKTTFVKIASTQLMPSAGRIEVLGYDVITEADKIRRRIAVVPQEGRPALLNTPYEHVYHYLIARGMGLWEARRRTKQILDVLELGGYANTLCSQLSGGLRQRTLVATALATDAELLFLDEPTIGLDAITRIKIWDVIRTLTHEEGRTVILTTHYMEEAETLSDAVAIIDRGRIVARGGVDEVRSLLHSSARVEVIGGSLTLEELNRYGKVVRLGETVRVYVDDSHAREVVGLALERGARASVSRVTLEDVFVSLVGEGLES